MRNPAQGRPLGFLYLWMLDAANHVARTKHHRDFRAPYDARVLARHDLAEHPDYAEFSRRHEREQREDEGDEPVGIP